MAFGLRADAKARTGTTWWTAAAAMLAVAVAPALAGPDDEAEEEEAVALDVGRRDAVVVVGQRPPCDSATPEPSVLESGRSSNLGVALRSIAGIDGVRRSQNAMEPVIRGLGWERVQTQLDGIPLHGACPARMDPPATRIGAGWVRKVEAIKGVPSVSLGPGGTGGRISISTDYERSPTAERELRTSLGMTYDAARGGLASDVSVQGGNRRLDALVGLESLHHGDYESARGVLVPAAQEERGAFLSLGLRPSASERWTAGAVVRSGRDTDYPALPMNADELDDRVLRVGYRRTPSGGRVHEWSARVGVATVDHLMSNRGKPNRSKLEAETTSTADTLSARAAVRFDVASRVLLEAGTDFLDLDRDALRERRTPASGDTAYDHIWPDVSQADVGLFAELTTTPREDVRLRVGLRADRVSSRARGIDDPSLQGRTIGEQWQRFYGPAAGDADRDESLVSGNLQVEWDRSLAFRWFAGIGSTSRAASVTERFFAFAPAPGGYLVGNPLLEAERKSEVVVGGQLRRERVRCALSVFYNDFGNYIYESTVSVEDVDGDTAPDRVRGFENVEATLYGGELTLAVVASSRWKLPISVAWVHAENDTAHRPLPEIPPLEATVACRAEIAGRCPGWIEIGARVVDRQDRVDRAFPEDETAGFSVFHLRGRFQVTRVLTLYAGVENLLDREYHEHLAREALLPVGGLDAGDEIPQPGRSAYLTARATF